MPLPVRAASGLDTVTIALTHAVDPSHAPVPRNESERLLFAQLYETLIRVDCTGRPYPGLAASWRADTSGRRWTFTLRDSASFWDGTPVTARDVAASWSVRAQRADVEDTLRIAARAADSVLVDDERTLTVVLRRAHRSTPLLFASPDLSVTKVGAHAMWPEGTGGYRVEETTAAADTHAASPAIVLRAPLDVHAPVLQFRVVSAADARDLLDGGIDVLMTSAPVVVSYAATRPELTSIPLAWDRTYVLLSPARVGANSVSDADSTFRNALARDAVRVEARGSEGPYWWADSGACTEAGAATPSSTSAQWGRASRQPDVREMRARPVRRIVYPRGDRVARDLADRLVALTSIDDRADSRAAMLASMIPGMSDGDGRWVAAGLPPDALAAALRDGRDAVYVLGLPRRVLAPCASTHALVADARWLGADTARAQTAADVAPAAGATADFARAVVPLIDTRSRLVVRRGVSGVAMEWDGMPYFTTSSGPSSIPTPDGHRP